ncbi:MAG: hypothetical protein EB127_28535 [Alphaproteobacteria bacterium]|nr:hypothetical protein [Alphaproteobacteria bacterium]
MNYSEMQKIANDNNLGEVYFEERIAINTGKPFEVGYVYVNNYKTLFCKKQSFQKDFYLCNEFRSLT